MADVYATSTNPTVFFQTVPGPTDWWRIYGNSSTDIRLERWFASSWHIKFEWTTTEVTSYSNFTIEASSPTLTFHNTAGGNDYTLSSDTSAFYLKRSTTTIAEADSNYFYANNGLGAGTNNILHAIQWRRYAGTLPASGSAITLTGFAGKVLGAIVMLTEGDSDQDDSTYQLYDLLDSSSPGNRDFHVKIGRNPSSADTLTIVYGAAYTSGTSLYKALVFFAP